MNCVDAFYPDACDNRVYYQCWQGVATRYECSPGTVWDVRIDNCNWDYLVLTTTVDPCGKY